ncbi:hypothetical protein CEXT_511171, partial [Caerostris extrusa]
GSRLHPLKRSRTRAKLLFKSGVPMSSCKGFLSAVAVVVDVVCNCGFLVVFLVDLKVQHRLLGNFGRRKLLIF